MDVNSKVNRGQYVILDRNEKRHNSDYNRHKRRSDMRNILLNELFTRGVGYKRVDKDVLNKNPVLKEFAISDSRMILHMLESNHEEYWGLALNTTILDAEDKKALINGQDINEVTFFHRAMLSNYASIFLADAWGT